MKYIIVLLLLTSLSFGSVSVSETTQERLLPLANKEMEFDVEFSKLIDEYPNDRKVILQTTVLTFKLTKEHIATLIELAYKDRIGGSGVMSIEGVKKPLPTPPSTTQN